MGLAKPQLPRSRMATICAHTYSAADTRGMTDTGITEDFEVRTFLAVSFLLNDYAYCTLGYEQRQVPKNSTRK